MEDVLRRFEEDLCLRELAVNTRKTYRWSLGMFLRELDRQCVPLESLTRDHVRDYLRCLHAEGAAPSSVRVHGSALRRWAKFTLQQPGLVEGLSLPRKKTPRPRPALTMAERQALLRAARGQPMHYVLVSVALATGARSDELRQLRTEDIDAEKMLVHIQHGKGDKARSVPMSGRLLWLLRRYWKVTRPPGPWLFPARHMGRRGRRASGPDCFTDRPVSNHTVRKRIRTLTQRGGLRHITPHDLRRTFATHLLEAGVHALVVQHLLGHSCLETTQRYITVRPERLPAVSTALDTLLDPGR